MKMKLHFKRVLSAMLVLVMLITMMPLTVHAADSTRTEDTIFFATDRHEETAKLKSLLQALEYEPGLVVLGGDHVNNTNSGSLASITAEIQTVYPGVQTFYTYAAHDPNVSPDSSNPYAFARTGEIYEGEDYYVYGVDQNDMQSSSNAAIASANFKNWAVGVEDGKMIFVMCHMPIHQRRKDNAGGATWMNALNEAGENHDIVFLWGHNHTGENTTDKNVYYVARGGSLTPQGGSKGTINFTYMNAGYIKNGYASMVVIDDEEASVTRYNTSGTVTASYTITREFAVEQHTHDWQITEQIEATCETAGSITTICSGCGEVAVEEIAALGHDYTVTTDNADCETGGSVTKTCTRCGDTFTEVIEALGHDYKTVTVEPTCEADGSVTTTCVNCGDSTVEVLEALGHNYESVITEVSCTTDGGTTHTCINCGDSYVTDYVAATGHTYTSEETDNSIIYTCEGCGHTYSESLAVEYEYAKVSKFTSGGNHVITLYSGKKYYAVTHNNNKLGVTQVTVSNNQITSEITEDMLWTYSNNNLSYKDGDTTYYMYLSSGSGWFSSKTLTVSTNSSSSVSLSSNRVKVDSYYLRYSSGSVKADRSATTAYLFLQSVK